MYLLGDIPNNAGAVESHHTVVGGDVVKRCLFLVTKHHLRDPDSTPGLLFHLEHRTVVVCGLVETQPRIEPPLAQIHTHRIVLYENTRHAPANANPSLLQSYLLPFFSK